MDDFLPDDLLPAHVKYWLSEANNDCFFEVGPESGPTERIGAIKLFLMGYSEPFRVMFGDSELAEKGDVRIIDIEPETLKMFLRCLYGGTDLILPKLYFKNCIKLLHVTEKYLVHDLNGKIVSKLSRLLTPNTVLKFLNHPICLRSKELEMKTLLILQNGFGQIMTNEKIFDLEIDSLMWILEKNVYKEKEIKIWEIVLKWGMHKTNSTDGEVLRSQILPLLKHIRFLTMDIKEFCKYVVPKDVLTKEEVYEICKSFSMVIPPNFEHLCNNRTSRSSRIGTSVPSKFAIDTFSDSGSPFVIASAKITNLKLNETIVSQPFHYNGHSWSIGVKVQANERSRPIRMTLFLKCEFNSDQRAYVSGEFCLINCHEEGCFKHFAGTLDKMDDKCVVTFNHRELFCVGYMKLKEVVVIAQFITEDKQSN